VEKATWKMPHASLEVTTLRGLDLRQVEVFYYVAKFRSFSKAAEALLLTQPTISGHIKALEESLSLVLFDRLGREVSLTRAGEVLYGYARRLLSTKTAALQALQELQGGLRGELILGGSSIPGQYVLPPVLGQFKRAYPAITVVLSITDTMDILERIVHGELELGFVGACVSHPQVAYQRFVEDELVLTVAQQHPWATQGAVPLAALLTEPFIQRERGSGSRLVIEQTLKQHGVEPAMLLIAAEMGSTEAIKQGIKAGIGVSIISRLALTDELRAGSLCTVAVQDVVFRRSFYSIRHQGRTLSPLGQTFVRFLHDLNPMTLLAQDSAHDTRA
jgi:DNA-binding transcriptional LysR family regulator